MGFGIPYIPICESLTSWFLRLLVAVLACTCIVRGSQILRMPFSILSLHLYRGGPCASLRFFSPPMSRPVAPSCSAFVLLCFVNSSMSCFCVFRHRLKDNKAVAAEDFNAAQPKASWFEAPYISLHYISVPFFQLKTIGVWICGSHWFVDHVPVLLEHEMKELKWFIAARQKQSKACIPLPGSKKW